MTVNALILEAENFCLDLIVLIILLSSEIPQTLPEGLLKLGRYSIIEDTAHLVLCKFMNSPLLPLLLSQLLLIVFIS